MFNIKTDTIRIWICNTRRQRGTSDKNVNTWKRARVFHLQIFIRASKLLPFCLRFRYTLHITILLTRTFLHFLFLLIISDVQLYILILKYYQFVSFNMAPSNEERVTRLDYLLSRSSFHWALLTHMLWQNFTVWTGNGNLIWIMFGIKYDSILYSLNKRRERKMQICVIHLQRSVPFSFSVAPRYFLGWLTFGGLCVSKKMFVNLKLKWMWQNINFDFQLYYLRGKRDQQRASQRNDSLRLLFALHFSPMSCEILKKIDSFWYFQFNSLSDWASARFFVKIENRHRLDLTFVFFFLSAIRYIEVTSHCVSKWYSK